MPSPAPPTQKNYLLTTLLGSFWNILQFVVSFVVTTTVSILLTRHFGPNIYGLFAYLAWFSSVILLILNFGLLTTVQTWVPKYFFTGELSRAAFVARQLLKAQVAIILTGLAILLPVVFAWHSFVSFPRKEFTTLMLINLLPIAANILNIFFSTLLVSLQRFKPAVLIYITGQVLTLSAVVTVVLQHQGPLGLLLWLGGVNVVMLVLFIRASRDILWQMVAEWRGQSELKKLLSFSGWAYMNIVLSAVIWDKSEFFFLGKFQAGKAIALYGIAYTLSTMVTALLDPVLSVFNTLLAELVAKKDWQRIRLIIRLCSKYASLLLLPLVTLAYALSPYVVRFVYGQEFLLVASIFPVLLFSSALNRIFAPAWLIPQYLHDLHRIVPRNVAVAILNISLDIFLIPRFGVWGAVIANIGTQLAALTYFGLFVRRYSLHLFTLDYFKVMALNVALFALIFVTVRHQAPFGQSLTFSLAGVILYGIFVWKKFINTEDRQLVTNSILALKTRSVA